MSSMIEIYYAAPFDGQRELAIVAALAPQGGKLTHREADAKNVTLTFEFKRRVDAERGVLGLSKSGLHVEGPSDY